MKAPAQRVLLLCLECCRNLTSTHSVFTRTTQHTAGTTRDSSLLLPKRKVIAFICSRKADLFPLVLNEHVFIFEVSHNITNIPFLSLMDRISF